MRIDKSELHGMARHFVEVLDSQESWCVPGNWDRMDHYLIEMESIGANPKDGTITIHLLPDPDGKKDHKGLSFFFNKRSGNLIGIIDFWNGKPRIGSGLEEFNDGE